MLERRGREEFPSLAGDMVLLNRLVILWQLLQQTRSGLDHTHHNRFVFIHMNESEHMAAREKRG